MLEDKFNYDMNDSKWSKEVPVVTVNETQQQPKRLMYDFNELSKQIHSEMVAVGWWDNPDQCLLEKLQMISTEIAEATEGERKDLMDDKLPHRKMGEVELADTLIRVLDLGGKLGLEYVDRIVMASIHKYLIIDINKTTSIAGKHFLINRTLTMFASFVLDGYSKPELTYSLLIESIMEVGKFRGYDIIGALHEKCAYNRERADHKRENRSKTHGKKF